MYVWPGKWMWSYTSLTGTDLKLAVNEPVQLSRAINWRLWASTERNWSKSINMRRIYRNRAWNEQNWQMVGWNPHNVLWQSVVMQPLLTIDNITVKLQNQNLLIQDQPNLKQITKYKCCQIFWIYGSYPAMTSFNHVAMLVNAEIGNPLPNKSQLAKSGWGSVGRQDCILLPYYI